MLVKVKSLSCVRLFVTPGTIAYQAPRSMGFSRQEYWSGLPFPSPGDLPNPGIKSRSPAWQTDACGEKGTLLHYWWKFKLQPLFMSMYDKNHYNIVKQLASN